MKHHVIRRSVLPVLSDILLWGVIICLLAGGVAFWIHWQSDSSAEAVQARTIALHFEDASQLAKGSPVFFMGGHVGYVTRVRPEQKTVHVELKTFRNLEPLPKGALFTVEFSGLAGAASLQVRPPGTKSETAVLQNGYYVEEPFRLIQAVRQKMMMDEALALGAKNLRRALGELEDDRALLARLNNANHRILEMDRTMVYVNETLEYQSQRVPANLRGAANSMQAFIKVTEQVDRMTSPAYFRRRVNATLRFVEASAEELEKLAEKELQANVYSQRMLAVNDQITGMGNQSVKMVNWLTDTLDQSQGFLQDVHQKLTSFGDGCQTTYRWKKCLDKLEHRTEQFKNKTEKLDF